MRPRVIDVELQVVAEPLPDVALERVVVGDGVICAAVDDAEQRRGFGVQIVGSQFALWHLIDVDREVQIGAMVPDIRECERVAIADLTLQGQGPLIVRRDWGVVLVITYVATGVVLRVRCCRRA